MRPLSCSASPQLSAPFSPYALELDLDLSYMTVMILAVAQTTTAMGHEATQRPGQWAVRKCRYVVFVSGFARSTG